MFEKLVNIIFPNEIGLQIIIWLIIILATAVIAVGMKIAKRTANAIKIVEAATDVESLSSSLMNNHVDYDVEFDTFKNKVLEDSRAKEDPDIFEHIRTIYQAGINCSRLDGKLLVENTISSIFKNADILKSIISMFLVVGILGTLIGLGLSILQFSNLTITSNNTGELNEVLQNLFSRLRGAFAPSIWGIATTIVSVLGYSYFIHGRCINRLTELLTNNTIKYWLPKLYPTEFQRGENTIAQFNETVKNAKGINSNVEKLQNNLSESNKTVKAFTKMAKEMEKSSDTFKDSVAEISNLKHLFDTIKRTSDQHNENIKNVSSGFNKAMADVLNRSKTLSTDITNMCAGLQGEFSNIQSGFAESNKVTIAAMAKAAKLVKDSNEKIISMAGHLRKMADDLDNREEVILKKLLVPLYKAMEEQSKTMQGIQGKLKKISNPLDKTSDQMADWMKVSYQNTTKTAEEIAASVAELKELSTAIKDIAKADVNQINLLARTLKEQNQHMAQLEDSILTLGDGLAKSGAISNGHLSRLGKTKIEKKTFMEQIKDNWGYVLIGGLLLISVIFQGVMLTKMVQMEGSQATMVQTLQNMQNTKPEAGK